MAKWVAISRIEHGAGSLETDPQTGKGMPNTGNLKTTVFEPGETVDQKVFSEDEWDALVEAGAVSSDQREIDNALNPPPLPDVDAAGNAVPQAPAKADKG